MTLSIAYAADHPGASGGPVDHDCMWAVVPQFPEYEASACGQFRKSDGRIVAQRKDRDGYLLVHLRGKNCRAHRYVASAHLGVASDGMVVNHKNFVRHDNRIENLEWCTPFYNSLHAWAHHRTPWLPYIRKLDDAHAIEIRNRIAAGEGAEAIAADYPASAKTIRRIANGDCYAEIGGPRRKAGSRWRGDGKADVASLLPAARQLREQGASYRQIAAEFGLSRSHIHRLITRGSDDA